MGSLEVATFVSRNSEGADTRGWSNLDCPHSAFQQECNKQLLCTLSCLLKQISITLQKEIFIRFTKFIINILLSTAKILSFAFMFCSSCYAPVMSFCVFNSAAFLLLMDPKGCSSIINVNLYKKTSSSRTQLLWTF